MVDKMVRALMRSPSMDLKMKEACSLEESDDSNSAMETDDDMVLLQYQKDAKLEAMARRAPNKSSSRSKKGRKSPTT